MGGGCHSSKLTGGACDLDGHIQADRQLWRWLGSMVRGECGAPVVLSLPPESDKPEDPG